MATVSVEMDAGRNHPTGGIMITGGALWNRNELHRSTPPLTRLTRYLRSSGSTSTILRIDAIRAGMCRRSPYCGRIELHCSSGSRSWRPALLCRKENISKPRSKRIEQESGTHLARVLVILAGPHTLCAAAGDRPRSTRTNDGALTSQPLFLGVPRSQVFIAGRLAATASDHFVSRFRLLRLPRIAASRTTRQPRCQP